MTRCSQFLEKSCFFCDKCLWLVNSGVCCKRKYSNIPFFPNASCSAALPPTCRQTPAVISSWWSLFLGQLGHTSASIHCLKRTSKSRISHRSSHSVLYFTVCTCLLFNRCVVIKWAYWFLQCTVVHRLVNFTSFHLSRSILLYQFHLHHSSLR